MLLISIVGFITGFIFSVPVAGPISIFITSKGLNGELGYGLRVAIGASIVDFIYCLLAVLGFEYIASTNQNIIPILLGIGTVFIFVVGIRIIVTHKNKTSVKEDEVRKVKTKGGFITGFLINFLNPTLFFGWLSSTIMVMSIITSLGIVPVSASEGDFLKKMNLRNDALQEQKENNMSGSDSEEAVSNNSKSTDGLSTHGLLKSISYAFFLSLGTVVWFYIYLKLLVKNRSKFKIATLNKVIMSLGFVLCGFGIYMGYTALSFIL